MRFFNLPVMCCFALATMPFGFSDALPSNKLTAQEQKAKPKKDDEANPKFSDTEIEYFETKIRPILAKRCYECHGPDLDEVEGELRFSSRGALLKGGETGPAIIPGDPKNSLLIDTINYGEVYEMPPDSKMPADEIALLTEWVTKNAPWPMVNDAHLSEAKGFDLEKRKQDHWCWQVPQKTSIPNVKDSAWPLDPIDHFILQKNEAAGLSMAPAADRRTWIRRVYFDLTGLPPTPSQVKAFEDDRSDKAFEKVVDELMASKHFGERWARHWMDLIRYAETCGHEFEYPIPHAYQYRDYLIRAFNSDVPYDQIIKEHIAGDLLDKPRRNPELGFNESIVGTGFWFLDEATHAPVDVRLDEANHIDNRIDVMSKTFLGLTVACARCHDHKFDAISAKDYYALAGFLQSSRRQLAMLDPNGKIAEAKNKIQQLRRAATAEIRKAMKLEVGAVDEIANYLTAASKAAQALPAKSSAMIEGEDLKVTANNAGETRVQEMSGFGNRWSGAKQLFWLADKTDGELKLELNVPESNEYILKASYTKAPDYGIFQMEIDGKKVGKPIDGFHGGVVKQDSIEIGRIKLNKGKSELGFKITGTNPKSNPKRYMIGIDFIELIPVKELVKPNLAAQTPATTEDLDPKQLQKWTAALQVAKTNPDHPLWLWQQVTKNGKGFDLDAIKNLQKSLDRQTEIASHKTVNGKPQLPHLFTDFSEPHFGDWFVTGEAFGNQPTQKGHWDSESNAVYPAGMADSSQYSKKLHGVLRSPTFELQSNEIWYRIKGNNVKIRLIIDGFVMDVYNGLLFSGAAINVNTKDQFQWVRQAGDIRRYKGHRAHIEIIDQGGGYAVVDKVIFSDSGRPDHVSPNVARLLPVLKDAANINDFTKKYAAAIGSDESLGLPMVTGTDAFQSSLARTSEMIKAIEREIPNPILAPAMTEGSPENERVFIRGNHKTLGPVANRQLLVALVGEDKIEEEAGSGRLRMAEQIANGSNPLTGRVVVNRLWHHIFGRGIVASPDNFGVLGQKPSHPELLDYLANEFVADGWSVKRMLKRMVLSRTYRMSSQINPQAKEVDPENILLHRSSIRRLQGEAIRDSILAISGRLDPKVYGPSVALHLTAFMQGRGRPGRSGPVDGDGRRSIYTEIRRNFLPPMLVAFDMPIPFNSIGRRNLSNVPAQALIMMNDPFVVGQAEVWAKKLVSVKTDIPTRIAQMYEQAFSRPPSDVELKNATTFIELQAKELGVRPEDIPTSVPIWQDLCHVVFNVKEFIYLK